MPNDQELSHATRDFRTAEIRGAKLKAPTALAPVRACVKTHFGTIDSASALYQNVS
jgi:hypothetical protein